MKERREQGQSRKQESLETQRKHFDRIYPPSSNSVDYGWASRNVSFFSQFLASGPVRPPPRRDETENDSYPAKGGGRWPVFTLTSGAYFLKIVTAYGQR